MSLLLFTSRFASRYSNGRSRDRGLPFFILKIVKSGNSRSISDRELGATSLPDRTLADRRPLGARFFMSWCRIFFWNCSHEICSCKIAARFSNSFCRLKKTKHSCGITHFENIKTQCVLIKRHAFKFSTSTRTFG